MFKIEVLLTASPELLAVLSVIAGMGTSAKKSTPSDGGSQAKTKEEAKKIVDNAKPVAGTDKEEKPAVEITVEQVRAAVQKSAQAGHREESKALLTAFKADKVTSLKKEDYAKFLEGLALVGDQEAFTTFIADLIPF